MLNIRSGSKSVGQEEKRSGQVRSQPLREHELLGLPKSTGKKENMNKTTIEKPRMQPVRMKDFFAFTDCKKTTKTAADRRMTTMPNATNSVRRKLYNEPPRCQTSPENKFVMTASNCLDKTFTDIHSNTVGGQKTSRPIHLPGLSKSDGKINKWGGLGRERMKPEKMKNFVESWENSQTVQPSARKSRTVETRNQNVCRKLYGVTHSSPITMSKNIRKSVAQSKLKTQKISIVNGNVVKPDIKKSEISKQTRKSCLLPPNSIRDKHICNRQNDTIVEESTLSIMNENESPKPENSNVNVEIFKIFENNEIEKLKSSLSIENVTKDTKKCNDKNCDERMIKNEIPRPSVIMGISAKGIRREQQNESSDGKKSSIPFSRIPLQELSRNTSLRKAPLDVTKTSLEDLLGINCHSQRNESIYNENLPRASFLESTLKTKNSSINIDRQTLYWMHGNLKLNVQSIEEQLFSMKLLLKTLEEMMINNDNLESQESETNIEPDNVTSTLMNLVTKSVDSLKIDEKEEKNCQENEVERRTTENMQEIRVHLVEPFIENLENNVESPIFVNNDEQDKENSENIGEITPRRSARLAKKLSRSPKRSDDSFSRIEQELNIIHLKANKNTPLNVKTKKRFDPRSRRSVREYMALKSTTNFLDTPDIKGFPTPKGEKDTPSHTRMIRRSLSRKVLTELDDLYAESPN